MLSELLPIVETVEIWSSALAFRPEQKQHGGGLAYEAADGSPADAVSVHMSPSLFDGACQRNVFAEPWMLQAAGAHLVGSKRVRVLVSTDRSNAIGIVPVALPSGPSGLLPVAAVWTHLHCFESTPLVQAGAGQRFLDDLFAWLDRHDVAVLRWPRLCLDGSFGDELFAYLERTGRASNVVHSAARPMLYTRGRPKQENIDRVLSNKRRRKVNRCRRRLSELGEVSFRSMERSDDSDRWFAEFCRLEASGWKGADGAATALACRADERAYFKRVFFEAARRDQLVVHSLELDGQPIAMTVNYRSGDGVWAYKTAYDERYARFGPGVIVELEGTLQLIDDPRVNWADSCSDPDNLVMQELWPDRRIVGDVLIAVRPGRSLAVPALARAERGYLAGKQLARSCYWRLQEWRRKVRMGTAPTHTADATAEPAA